MTAGKPGCRHGLSPGFPASRRRWATPSTEPENFTNQRPRIAVVGDALGLAWERALEGRATSNLYYCELDQNGTVTTPVAPVDPTAGTLFAQVIPFASREFLLYEQSAAGAYRVILSEKDNGWSPQVLGRGLAGSSQFPHAVVFKGSLYVFWEVEGGIDITARFPSSEDVGCIPSSRRRGFPARRPGQQPTLQRSAGNSRTTRSG